MRKKILPLVALLLGLIIAFHPVARSEGRPIIQIDAREPDTVVVAVPKNFPPYHLTDASGKPDGLAIDIAKALGHITGLKFIYKSYDGWRPLIAALKSGEADIVVNMGITPARQKYLDFTQSYETLRISYFIRTTSQGILTPKDLATARIGVIEANRGKSLLEKRRHPNLVVFHNVQDAIFSLLSGDIDAFVFPEKMTLKIARAAHVENMLRIVGKPLIEVKRAVGVRKGQTALLKRLDTATDIFIKSPAYKRIFDKWFGKPQPFWTTQRVVISFSVAFGVGLLVISVWRYRVVARFNAALCTSIAAKVAAEKKLREINTDLEDRVAQRTRDLQNATRRAENRSLELAEQIRARHESEDKYRSIINTTTEGYWLFDADNITLEVNAALCDMLDYSAKEIIGRPLEAFLTHEHQNHFKPHRKHISEASLLTKNGRIIHARFNVTTYQKTSDGQKLTAFAFVSDMTERILAEKEITRLSRRNELILNAAGEGIYGIDKNGNCTFVNPAAADLLGWRPEELIGRLHQVLLGYAEPGMPFDEDIITPTDDVFRDGKTHTFTSEVFWRKDGTSIPVEYTATPITDDGEITGAVVVFRDVSKQREMQQKLLQSSKMATLGEMATGVAHELNQPLNVISIALGNILRKIENGTADALYTTAKLNKISTQVERATSIIEHMRIFGRNPPHTMTRLDPLKMVEGTLSLIGEQLRLSEIEVITELPATISPIRGRQVQVEQVLLNLLANARDAVNATDNATAKKIFIRAHDDTQKKIVRIEVEDTGGGIAPEAITRVFEPFFTTKDVGQGTGLGLSISYGIIGDMGGALSVHNTDQGACFVIVLPSDG